jgi:2-C-methyl-D-erythritol 2,4-cyclodiphosphate synthase
MRVGFGYDCHRLIHGRRLVIGGVSIPHAKGLLGHSDADVLVHAIIDAMLGSLSLGDIGAHFPASDPEFKDISSIELLKRTNEMINKAGFVVSNIDSTVVLEEPRLQPHVPQMTRVISMALNCPPSCVSIKAKTEEGLGFTGTGQGISAHAVALLKEAIK